MAAGPADVLGADASGPPFGGEVIVGMKPEVAVVVAAATHPLRAEAWPLLKDRAARKAERAKPPKHPWCPDAVHTRREQ